MREPFNFPKPIYEINDSGNIKRPNTNILYKNKFLFYGVSATWKYE